MSYPFPRLFTLLLVLSFFCIEVSAQPINKEIGDVQLPDAEAAALGKYVEAPVSYFTGVPSIEVPIYMIQEGPIQVPISLSYHASGLRVGELATRVGAGWSCQGSGMIHRTVMGLHDEFGWLNQASQVPGNLTASTFSKFQDINFGLLDGEPDIFTFSAPGINGKFFLDKMGMPTLIQKRDWKITYILSSNPSDIYRFRSFIITNEGGTKYYFGTHPVSNVQSIELTRTVSTNAYASGWKLVRIESHDGINYVNYQYASDTYGYDTSPSCYYPGDANGNNCNYGGATQVQALQLSRIDCGNNAIQIDFVQGSARLDLDSYLGNTGHTLSRIEVSYPNSNYCKKFVLSHDYWQDDSAYKQNGSEDYRLQLVSVQEISCNNSNSIPPYLFDYHGPRTSNGQRDFFPNRLSKQRDHWEFYNGETANQNAQNLTNIPPTTINRVLNGQNQPTSHGIANRETSETHMKYGSLEEITYPWNGRTAYTFEANDYYGTAAMEAETVICTSRPCLDFSVFTRQKIFNSSDLSTVGIRVMGTLCEFEPGPVRTITIALFNDSNTELAAHDYQTDGGQDFYFDDLLTAIFPQIQANTSYYFELRTRDANYTLHIYHPPTTTQTNIKVGGLRIAQLTTHDGISTNNDIVRSISYRRSQGHTESSGVLYRMPVYGYDVNLNDLNGASISTTVGYTFTNTPVVPLSSFEGYHINYGMVIDSIVDQGRTEHIFYTEPSYAPTILDFPFPPDQARIIGGNPLRISQYTVSNMEVGKTTHTPHIDAYELTDFPILKVQSLPNPSFVSWAYQYYNIRSRPYREALTSSYIDGVQTAYSFTYDSQNRFLAPMTETVSNSDVTEYITSYTYTHDYSDNLKVRDTLLSQNRIIPWQTSITADNVIVDGSRTLYSFYNTAGTKTTSGTDYLYSGETQRREITWNQGGTRIDNNWISQHTTPKYQINVGKPAEVLINGWQDPLEYTWTTSGRLDFWKFINFQKDFTYFSNSDLLQSTVAIDGTITSFTYDDLLRLRTTSNCQGVTTTIAYHYSTGGTDKNYIQTLSSYPKYGEELFPLVLSNKQIMDGLGREIQSLRLNQASGDPTKHLATWTSYDNVGRPTRQYDPQAVSAANYTAPSGDYVETLYEDSPLNRPISSGHSAWYPSETNYGSNIANEVNGYATNTLNKFVQKVPTHTVGSTQHYTEQISYTDKRGRQVLMRTRDTETGATTDTYKTYDDKDRPYQIIPPDATINDAGLIYTNLYFGNDLLWQKKVPDRDWEEFRYNDRDLLAYRQDGFLNDKSQWMANQYDPYGRLTHQGFYNSAPAANNSFDAAIINESLLDNEYGTAGIEKGKLVKSEAQLLGTSGSITRNLGYDACGRQNHIWGNTIKSLSDLTAYDMTTVYDDANNILSTTEQIHADLTILSSFDYDHAGRQSADYIKINNLAQQQISASTYTAKEQVESLVLGNNLQIINFAYKANGFLESINNPSSLGNDLWAMELGYDASTTASTPGTELRKDGNITSAHWKVAGQSKQAMNYTYNYQSFLTAADYFESGNNGLYSTTYSYQDRRGNFNNVTRNGIGGVIDDLNYTYHPGTNLIKSISDGGTASVKSNGYKSNTTDDYIQNDNGFITYDAETGATLGRDHNDLLSSVSIPSDNINIINVRDASGTLHQRQIDSAGIIRTIEYIGSAEYRNGAPSIIPHSNGYVSFDYGVPDELFLTGTVNHTKTEEGLDIYSDRTMLPSTNEENKSKNSIFLNKAFEVQQGGIYSAYIEPPVLQGLKYHYSIKDHLGSPRIIFSDADNNGTVIASEIESIKNYYSFGLEWQQNNKLEKYRNAYNDKEAVSYTNYLEFEARGYIKSINMFDGPDPISGSFPHLSTTNYASLSPVTKIDLWGLQAADSAWPNDAVQKGAQKVADGITWVIDQGKAGLNFVGALFKQGGAEGNPREGTPSESDQMITILATSKGKNSEGSNPAPDGEGSTVILESGELAFPGGPSMRGAISKDAPASLQQLRNISKGMDKAAKVKNIVESNNNGKANEESSNQNTARSEVFNDSTPLGQQGNIDTITINGRKYQRITNTNSNRSSSATYKPIE